MEETISQQELEEEVEELAERGFSVNAETGRIVGFNENFFAQYIKERLNILYSTDGFFYIYKKGVWVKQDDQKMYKKFREILQEPRYGVWRQRMEVEYIGALKRELYFSKELNQYRNIINLKNGVFDINNFEFLPHDPTYRSTIQIPLNYNKDADCPNFIKFLSEIFEGDDERIAVAQEWFGYALTTETKAQKVLMLYGAGGNGKGVFVDILSLLIGEENISHIPLNELHKGFSRVCLYGKTANICSENESDDKPINTQYFKAIVGEDTINAEQKNKPVFSFKPTVKLILSMNNLPKTRDKSTGYYRRLMILGFTAYFNEENRDKDLKEKLRKELSGIFLWAMEGLKRLQDNDYKFSKCTDMDNILKEYMKEQNPIIEFIEECVNKVEDPDHRENNKVVYDSFKHWAEINGHKGYATVSNQRFWKEFEAVLKAKDYNFKAGRSNDLRYHTGIKVKQEYRIEIRKRPYK